jgi:hypothetical protein
MMKTRVSKRRLVRCLGALATAALMLSAASSQRAEALSPINPGAVPAAKYSSDGLVTEVRGGHGGGGHRGGGGFHGGGGRGFHGGAFHGGGFRSFHGGHFHHRGFAFRHRFHHRHVYFAPSYYGYPRCRVIWTYHGPRRICHYRHWRHHRYHRAYW